MIPLSLFLILSLEPKKIDSKPCVSIIMQFQELKQIKLRKFAEWLKAQKPIEAVVRNNEERIKKNKAFLK